MMVFCPLVLVLVMRWLIVVVMMAMTVPPIGTPFGLKGILHLCQISSEAMKHLFDYMVWADEERVAPNLCGQVTISQVPGKTNEVNRVLMSDFDYRLACGLNAQPSAILHLQAIPIGHCNRVSKIEKNILTLI